MGCGSEATGLTRVYTINIVVSVSTVTFSLKPSSFTSVFFITRSLSFVLRAAASGLVSIRDPPITRFFLPLYLGTALGRPSGIAYSANFTIPAYSSL